MRTKFIGIACVLVMASVIVSCGGDGSSRDRNVSTGGAASVIGTSCKELGKITKKKGISYVCARVKPRAGAAAASFGPKSGILYGVAVVKNWRCEKLGGTRYQNGIFSVCSGGNSRKSRKWALTTPLPVAVAALVDAAETSRIGSLEEAGVAVPVGLAPGPADIAASQQAQAVSGDGTGPIIGTTTTSSLPPAYVVKLAPDAAPTSPTTVAPATTSGQSQTTAATETTQAPVTTQGPSITSPSSQWVKLAVASVAPVCERYPGDEAVENSIDENVNTKYLCQRPGDDVELGGIDFTLRAPSIVYGFKIATANDCDNRNPAGVNFQMAMTPSAPWSDAQRVDFEPAKGFKVLSTLISLPAAPESGPATRVRMLVRSLQSSNFADNCTFDVNPVFQLSEVELWGVSVTPTTSPTTSPTTTPSPLSSSAPSTTVAPSTTIAPTTTGASTSTVAPTTTNPKKLTCAEGGPCQAGDVGPGGGIVVLSNFNLSAPASLIEVAPVTWWAPLAKGRTYADGLVFGRKSDWRMPTVAELLAIRRDRAQFRCPGSKRCKLGFAKSVYLAGDTWAGGQGVDFNSLDPQAKSATSGFIRPVRTIGPFADQTVIMTDFQA